jgi:hypothetical protein
MAIVLLVACKDNFEVVAAEAIMMRSIVSDWTLWSVEELENKVKCQICGDIFTKKNARMLSHLGYIHSTIERDNNMRLCKNMKPDMAHPFCGCGTCISWMRRRGPYSTGAYRIAFSSR